MQDLSLAKTGTSIVAAVSTGIVQKARKKHVFWDELRDQLSPKPKRYLLIAHTWYDESQTRIAWLPPLLRCGLESSGKSPTC